MDRQFITPAIIADFAEELVNEEKSPATIEKYLRDVRKFSAWLEGASINKQKAIAYKEYLNRKEYQKTSINSMLASLNHFFIFLNRPEWRVRAFKIQKKPFSSEEKELSYRDYKKLLSAARGDHRMWLVMQTLCACGIRVSELRFFTVETVRKGEVVVACKNKTRVILIPDDLSRRLLAYAKKSGIRTGVIFCTRNGRALDRTSIWLAMKKLSIKAKINPSKVFPHNLRKLFARTFYKKEKDIAKLADILGHSNINTTRIYLMETGREHRQLMNRLQLLA